MTKLLFRFGLVAVPLALAMTGSSHARACGGCFHPPDQPAEQSSVVVAHRMALSISPDQSVLWDQVQYTGSPGDFAWVLPVKAGARLEVATDAWLEALDAATTVRIAAPTLQCVTKTQQQVPGASTTRRSSHVRGCSGSSAAVGCSSEPSESDEVITGDPTTREVDTTAPLVPPQDPVTIVHQGSAGPYETVTLHANVQGALPTWLTSHGYAIDQDIQPILDAYAAEGFDFIAIRLLPNKGVQQMEPVRVIQQGAITALPLRMVAAGAGANVALTLFVISEGRYEPSNFSLVDRPNALVWDFQSSSSDYASERAQALHSGPSWMTASAISNGVFATTNDPVRGAPIAYQTGFGPASTLADAFFDQAFSNGETAIRCAGLFADLGMNNQRVVDPCPPDGGDCRELTPGELDARYLDCGPVHDLAAAMTGLHTRDVWVTRLEADLPRQALSSDLELRASSLQAPLSPVILASSYTSPPCQVAGATASRERSRRFDGGYPAIGAVVVAGALLRRARRRR